MTFEGGDLGARVKNFEECKAVTFPGGGKVEMNKEWSGFMSVLEGKATPKILRATPHILKR